ncbi:MAG: nucleotidyltransferase family protein [Alphaproteobacteria bacterium]|nr:nucleotidyltransferase family protein [Alphaproteobacteria bacterium]
MVEQCLILVGGRGTRLGRLTDDTPKPLVPVAGRPFLDWLLERLAGRGLAEIVLLAGYLGERFVERYDGKRIGATALRCVIEDAPRGTGGALAAVPGLAEEFFMMNGDSLFDVDLAALAGLPADEGWLGKLALRGLPDTSRSGVVTVSSEGRIDGFAERGGPEPGLINGGVYLLRRAILDRLLPSPCSIERDVFPALAAEGRLWGRAFDAYFIDIGVPEDLARAQIEVPRRHRPTPGERRP